MARWPIMVLAAVLMVLASPVFALAALLVRLTLGAPVLFRQQRSGLQGTPFTLVKFRSMTDACGADGALLPDALRTPWAGRLIRRTRLDELPQLWNVARGDMAFIGPRPLLPQTITEMGEHGWRRGQMRPGMTGWSQVNGGALLANDRKVELDLWYIDNCSVRLDALIVLKTVMVVLLGEHVSADKGEKRNARGSHRRG